MYFLTLVPFTRQTASSLVYLRDNVVELRGLEPLTSSVQRRRSPG